MRTKRRVSDASAGTRLDAFLAQEFPLLSRRQAKALCREQEVFCNGKPAKGGMLLRAGDVVELEEVYLQARARPELVDLDASAVEVLYEDDAFLAIAKPPLMASVVIRGDDALTAADHIAAIAPQCATASKDPREAGLVQRLDYSTSGVMIAAKTPAIWNRFHQMLLSGAVQKDYLALVEGRLSGTEVRIDLPLRSAAGGERMQVAEADSVDSLPACSHIRKHSSLLGIGENVSLLKVQGAGMRRHQVRAHLASLGLPLVGDALYGAKSELSLLHIHREGFLLHASEISFKHPQTAKIIKVSSESAELVAIAEMAGN